MVADFDFLDENFDFTGSKIALILGDSVLVSLRDNIPAIPYPNSWDLPGGGREGDETPFECAAREVWEELGLTVAREDIIWAKVYPSLLDSDQQSVFLAGRLSQEQFDAIRFGDEGQAYKLMKLTEFVEDEQIIPPLRGRVRDFMENMTDDKA